MTREQVYPRGWYEHLQETLDLHTAYQALRSYRHFHSFTLRAFLRHVQGRPDDALALLDEAESRFPGGPTSREDNRRYLYMLMLRVEANLFHELSGSRGAVLRTDESLERLVAASREAIDEEQGLRVREKTLALWQLHRGLYQDALDRFERLIDATRRTPERSLSSYVLASAAAHELGLHKESRRHYENAELTVAFHDDRLTFCQFLTCLLSLCRHWGWEREAARWDETIRVLDCPESTRQALFERAALLEAARREGRAVALA